MPEEHERELEKCMTIGQKLQQGGIYALYCATYNCAIKTATLSAVTAAILCTQKKLG